MERLGCWGEGWRAGAPRSQGLRTERLGGELKGEGLEPRGAATAPTKGLPRAPRHQSPTPEARPTRHERPQAPRTQAPANQPNPSRPDANARSLLSPAANAVSQKPIKQPSAASRSEGRKGGAGCLKRRAAAPASPIPLFNNSHCHDSDDLIYKQFRLNA